MGSEDGELEIAPQWAHREIERKDERIAELRQFILDAPCACYMPGLDGRECPTKELHVRCWKRRALLGDE